MKRATIAILSFLILFTYSSYENVTVIQAEDKVNPTIRQTSRSISFNEVVKTPRENTISTETNDNMNISEEIISSEHVKEVADGVFQTVIEEPLVNSIGTSINFYTWSISDDQIKLLDKTMYNDVEQVYGYRIGEFYYQLWKEYPDFYLSFLNLELDSSFLTSAKIGEMVSCNIKLGTSLDELIETLGKPIVTDWYHGGSYYSYNDIAFILDEQMNVIAINMPGNRLKRTLNEVVTVFGAPSVTTIDELDNTLFYSYEIGNYTLSFEASSEEDLVRNIWLNQ